jgi:hypothetical protein
MSNHLHSGIYIFLNTEITFSLFTYYITSIAIRLIFKLCISRFYCPHISFQGDKVLVKNKGPRSDGSKNIKKLQKRTERRGDHKAGVLRKLM